MKSNAGGFQGSADKALIRVSWDLPLISEAHQKAGRALSYFGMPGPAIEDVLAWKDDLEYVTAVEYLRSGEAGAVDRENHRQLSARMSRQALAGGPSFQVLRGDVDDIILKGYDNDATFPQRRGQRPDEFVQFRYDVVNLDYCGGLAYPSSKASSPSKRVRALQKLFERQEGVPFLFFLTLNVRQLLDSELTSFLTQYRRELDGALHPIVDWYAARAEGERNYKLKAAVPLYVRHLAEHARFKVRCLPPIAYIGTASASMVHFAFQLVPTLDEFKAFSAQSPGDLLRQPLLQCANGSISYAPRQHDCFDWRLHDSMGDVPEEFREKLRAEATARLELSHE